MAEDVNLTQNYMIQGHIRPLFRLAELLGDHISSLQFVDLIMKMQSRRGG